MCVCFFVWFFINRDWHRWIGIDNFALLWIHFRCVDIVKPPLLSMARVHHFLKIVCINFFSVLTPIDRRCDEISILIEKESVCVMFTRMHNQRPISVPIQLTVLLYYHCIVYKSASLEIRFHLFFFFFKQKIVLLAFCVRLVAFLNFIAIRLWRPPKNKKAVYLQECISTQWFNN